MLGVMEGNDEGFVLGDDDAITLGVIDGVFEGSFEGSNDGSLEGSREGNADGSTTTLFATSLAASLSFPFLESPNPNPTSTIKATDTTPAAMTVRRWFDVVVVAI
mmetsp:Transcript_12662/g.22175  ORF Transcript_12662/g.22175 Transcript_12662/m.22175 type:complete len:105 (-) Transcript_12662:1119-1433(-)